MKKNKIFVCFLVFLLLIPSLSFCSNEGIMPLQYEENELTTRYSYIVNQIKTKKNYDISKYNGLVFYDEYSECYRVISVEIENNPSINFAFTDDYLDCIFWNGSGSFLNLYLFDVFSTGEVGSSNSLINSSKNINLGSYLGLSCITQFNFMFGICSCTSGYWYEQYSNWAQDITYITKSVPTNPYVMYDINNEFIINGNLFIVAGNTLVSSNHIIPFTLDICKDETYEIVNSIILDIEDEVNFYDSASNTFIIPLEFLSNYVTENGTYHFMINLFYNHFYYKYEEVSMKYDKNTGFEGIYDEPIVPPDDTDKIVDSIGNMSNTISSGLNEVNETNKNIWETIKSILNFINPASEDFFVYQLINLLIEALKSLFIPSQEFLNNWIVNMNEWLSDRLGVLYYPADLVVDFLTRIGNIEDSTAIIHIPEFKLNLLGYEATVIPEYTYNLNDLLTNETFKNLHEIYLVVVDVILYLGLVVLSYNTFVTIFGGKYLDDALDDVKETYNKYERKKEINEKSKHPPGMGRW